MRIFVTGGAGFIGTHLCKKLSSIHKVTVYDISGKSLLLKKINTNRIVFPTNSLSPGSYVLKALLDTGSIVEHKIIIR